MKDKRETGVFVKSLTRILSVILVIGTMCFVVADKKYVHAEENQGEVVTMTDTTIDYKVKQYSDISMYRTKDAFTTPTLTTAELVAAGDITPGEWLFAGWFTNSDCTSALSSSVVYTEGSAVNSGPYYAKFVPADVLSVKCQITAETASGAEETVLRCISTVDSLGYKGVGLHLVRPDGTVGKMEKSKVSKRIYARKDIDVEAYSYSPKVIDTESEYFFSATEVVNKDNFGEQYLVKPYWITKDDTTVWGVSRCVTVNEAIDKNVIHIPVKMDEAPTTGTTLSATDGTNPYTLTYCNKYDADTGYAHFALTTDNEGTSIKTDALKSVTTYTITRSDETTASYVYRNLLTTVGASDNRDTSWYTEAIAINPNENEFVIATSADLYGLADVVNDEMDVFAGETVYMVADIEANKGYAYPGDNGDITTARWKTDVAADGTTPIDGTSNNWPKIGVLSSGVLFAGTFDGQMHTISGIYASAKGGVGLFGETATTATIKDFALTNSYFNTEENKNYAGSIVSKAGGGTIENVYSNAIVTNGYKFVGGLVGLVDITQANFEMRNCWFDGKVTNKERFLGGLIGTFGETSSSATYTQTITNCLNTGEIPAISSSSRYVGGLFGYTYSGNVSISRCLNTGEIGRLNTSQPGQFNLLGTYASGKAPSVDSTYVTTQTTVTTDLSTGTASAEKNLYKVDPVVIAGTLALTATQTKDWFTNVTDEETYANESYWAITQGAPILSAFADVAGVQHQAVDTSWFRTDKTSFTLKDAADLYGLALLSRDSVAENFANEKIYLGADIVMNEGITYNSNGQSDGATPIGWLTIGDSSSNAFKGTFDGQGNNISGVYLNNTDTTECNGLFGYADTATIKKFSLTNSSFSSAGKKTGSVAGVARGGTYDSIYSTAFVQSSEQMVGGIIGDMEGSANFVMDNCWFAGTVTSSGTYYVGGLVGYLKNNSGYTRTMTNCLNSGAVNATNSAAKYIGGLVGYCQPGKLMTLENCLNTGTVVPAVSVTGENNTQTQRYGLIAGYLQNIDNIGGVYTIKQDDVVYAYTDTGAVHEQADAYSVDSTTIQGESAVAVLSELFASKTATGEDYWVTTTTTPVLKTFEKFAVGGADE